MKRFWTWFFIHNKPLWLGQGPSIPEIDTVLGEGFSLKGKLEYVGSARLDGHFEGEVKAKGCLIVGEKGLAKGTFVVDTLVVYGLLDGDAEALESVEIKHSGRLKGKVKTKQMAIEPGGIFEGEMERYAADIK